MVAATRKNPEIFGRKIAGFGIGFQVCATGWQRPGRPLFLLGPVEHQRGERPLPRPRNRTKPRTEKRHGPPSEKNGDFPCGLYSWRSWTLWGKSLVYARANCRKVPHRKQSSKHRGLGTTVNHVTIVRGESVRNCGHKKARGSGFTPPPPSGCWVSATGTGVGKVFQLWRVLL